MGDEGNKLGRGVMRVVEGRNKSKVHMVSMCEMVVVSLFYMLKLF